MNQNVQNTAVQLRKRLRAARRALPAKERDRGALLIRGRLFTWLATLRSTLQAQGRPDVTRIAAYWALPEEPDLHGLLRQWAQDEALTLALPVVAAADQPLQFRRWTLDTPMQPGPYGILEPEGPEVQAPQVVLVPTLGYTRQGDRLGYGGGYYDRTLAALTAAGQAPTTIGIAWACGDLSQDGYTPASHDIRLDSILTDKGWAVPAPEH